jgi:3-methyladenine DNA glycosylase Tag
MAIPERIKPKTLADYLDVMSKAVFQAGMRWALIESKWPAFRKAFFNFDPVKVSALTARDIDRLSQDASLIRSRAKIEGTVLNARRLVDLDSQFHGFANYLHSFDDYQQLAADLKKQFKFMGDLNAYYFLFRIGEPVPDFEQWVNTIPGDHPRMREMVDLARNQDLDHHGHTSQA